MFASILAVLAVQLAASSPGLRSEPPMSYRLIGAGAASCSEWTQYKLQDDPARYGALDWVLGYLSAFNNYAYPDGDIAHGYEVDQIAGWIDQYCERNRADTIAGATDALIQRLARADRRKTD